MASADDLIDQLAFGKTTIKSGPCLGLYLSPEVIYIADTHLEKGSIAVDHLVRIPVPNLADKSAGPVATGTLNTDFLTDNTKLSALIRQSMGAIKWSSKDVMVTLSHHLGLLRYFTMPSIDRRFWSAAVPLEAKKYIPIPFDTLSHDYQVVPLPPDASNKPRQGALVCVTQRKNLANINSLLESLGLKMMGLEVAPCSVLRVWESLDPRRRNATHCQVHFDGGNIRIMLADRGMPVFFRELFLGKEAELGDLRKVDLTGCVGFAQKQLAVGQMTQLWISGDSPNMAQWQAALGQQAGIAAALQDTPQKLGIKAGDWGGYSAIGASLRLLSPGVTTLDLGQVGRVADEERRTARNIFVAAGALALFFGLMGLYRNLSYISKARELEQFKREPEIEAVFKGKLQTDIEIMLRSMQSQATAVSAAGETSVKPTALLKDLVDSLPDNAWITSISYRKPIKGSKDAISLEIGGKAVAQSMAQEQDMAFEFRARLQKTPVLGALFHDIQVSVEGKPQDAGSENKQGVDPDTLRQRLEDRTSFKISMKNGGAL